MQKLTKEYGSEFDWESNNEYINSFYNHRIFQEADYFRSGRDALRAIALRYKGCYKQILIPALCCESMVNPFEINGYEVSFYRLNPDLSADFEDILSKIQSEAIFLYINYFGITSMDNEKLCYIKKQFENSILIEDRTHDILVGRDNGYVPNYTICSIRKWIAIPDGGLLFSTNQEIFKKEMNTYFGDVRTCALKNKSEYLRTGNVQIKLKFRNELDDANNYLNASEIVADISKKSYEILQYIDFEKIYQQRKINALLLYKHIENIDEAENISSTTENSTLYHPILVDNRDKVQKKLAKKDIYCPVIWPLPKQAVGVCKVSEYISNHMLAIPCDHRYRKSDIECICNILDEILEKKI